MENYNGKYEAHSSVTITCATHDECRKIAKLVRKFCQAWVFEGLSFTERKSARKGDVLERYFSIKQVAYSHSVIIFRESLHCILRFHCIRGTVKITRGRTFRENHIK